MDSPEWQQLYVNAEHDGKVGVITIGRESYNSDVDAELNRAIDWLKAEGIDRVIVTGDFHLATQMVGADTARVLPGPGRRRRGAARSPRDWSRTARRLHDEFQVSVGFVNGKRCLGGFLELLLHCHYLVAVDDAELGMPEVTLPVVPGMEGCHWPFRKSKPSDWPKLLQMLLSGRPVAAARRWAGSCDFAGPLDEALSTAWKLASSGDHGIARRKVEAGVLAGMPTSVPGLPEAEGQAQAAARQAIMDCIKGGCGTTLAQAIDVQAKISGDFMVTKTCMAGVIGTDFQKTMKI